MANTTEFVSKTTERFSALERLNRDLKQAAETLTPSEVRYYCQRYYTIQDQRKRAKSQLDESLKAGEPNRLLVFDLAQSRTHEAQIKTAMLIHARSTVQGRWMLSIFGVGPVIASGMLAHIDITKAPTVGHIWSFAGLVARIRWVGREEADKWVRAQTCDTDELIPRAALHFQKHEHTLLRDATWDFKTQTTKAMTPQSVAAAIARRPWNPTLKVLCWKASDCFKKFSNNPKDTLYGRLYKEFKARAVDKNLTGGFAKLAAETLETRNIRDPQTLATYRLGKLPDGRVDAWAMRATVKMFLSHIHHVLYETHFGQQPPVPYILAYEPDKHTQYIPPPNWPLETAHEADIDTED